MRQLVQTIVFGLLVLSVTYPSTVTSEPSGNYYYYNMVKGIEITHSLNLDNSNFTVANIFMDENGTQYITEEFTYYNGSTITTVVFQDMGSIPVENHIYNYLSVLQNGILIPQWAYVNFLFLLPTHHTDSNGTTMSIDLYYQNNGFPDTTLGNLLFSPFIDVNYDIETGIILNSNVWVFGQYGDTHMYSTYIGYTSIVKTITVTEGNTVTETVTETQTGYTTTETVTSIMTKYPNSTNMGNVAPNQAEEEITSSNKPPSVPQLSPIDTKTAGIYIGIVIVVATISKVTGKKEE